MSEAFKYPQAEAQILWGDEAKEAAASPLEEARRALKQGDLEAASSHARAAVTANGNDVDATCQLGEILIAQRDFEPAVEVLTRATMIRPDDPAPLLLLAQAYKGLKKLDKSIDCCRRAQRAAPTDYECLMALGAALAEKKSYPEAGDAFRRASGLDKARPEPQVKLAECLFHERNFEDSLGASQKALQVSNRHAPGYQVYGRALAALGQSKEALGAYKAAIRIDPLYAEAYAHMATCYLDMAQNAQALESAIQAVTLCPDLTTAQVSRASSLRLLGHIDESMVACHKAILTHSNLPEVHMILGHVYMDCGLPDEAAKSYERGLAQVSDLRDTHSALLVARQYTTKMSPADVLAEAKKWGAKFGAPIYPRPDPASEVKRIGFVSPNLNDHPTGRTLLLLAGALRQRGMELAFYGYGMEDAVSAELKSLGEWRNVTGLDDETASVIVAEDRIDALVDLTGHMERNRIGLFLNRPCGIQVAWTGHFGPMGSEAFDAVLTDEWMSPEGAEQFHTCPLVRLEDGTLLFSPPKADIVPIPGERAGDAPFTFGAICSTRQINRRTVAVWSEVLKQAPGSQLVIKAKGLHSTAIRKQYLGWFESNGVAPERIVCLGATSWTTHLAIYERVDLCLDPVPWSSTQATLEAAWMGVPTLACQGPATWQRGAGSVMKALGLDEFVVAIEGEYVERAVRLTHRSADLRELRTLLRGRLEESRMCDADAVAHGLVKALDSLTA